MKRHIHILDYLWKKETVSKARDTHMFSETQTNPKY